MTSFYFQPTVPQESSIKAALGASTVAKFTDADIGKPVKLGVAQNYVLCTAGDEIEGFVTSVEPYTVNGGFSFGGVLEEGYFECVVDTGQTVSIGTMVVAGTQTALNTAGPPVIRPGAAAVYNSGAIDTPRTPAYNFWKVVRIITGTGVAGDRVLIKRVGC